MKTVCLAVLLALVAAPAEASKKTPPGIAARGGFMALRVPDIDASVMWYTEKLALRVVERPPAGDGVQVAILEGEGLIVELIAHHGSSPRGASGEELIHGIFKAGVIVEDLDALAEALVKRGVKIAFGPYPARGKQRANLIIRDNSGNLIQFFEV